MTSEILKSIDDLDDESDQYAKRYSALASRSPNDPVCVAFVKELKQFLLDCLAHGRFFGSGSPERRALRALVEEWDTRLQRDGHHLQGIDQLAPYDPAAGVVLESECPYPGLDAYRADRAGSFFGRTELIKRYVDCLLANRIFLILGASGSGKSSLALAGIKPRLQDRYRDWIYPTDFTPGSAPLDALATAVTAKTNRASEAGPLAHTLRTDPRSAPVELARLCDGRPLMLLIDQFEELITLCRESTEQAAFAQVLLALSDPPAVTGVWTCYTLITLRTDHLARFENSNALKPLYVRLVDNRNSELLTTLTFDDIKRAIAEPAKEHGLRFSPSSIIASLASQTAGLANGLPLLQFALRRLWDTRPKDKETGKPLDLITQEMVDALPDVQRSLGKVAEGIYVELSDRQKEICARALQELVLLDENFEEPLRRRRNRGELLSVLASRFPGPKDDINDVEQRFIAAGLLRTFGHGAEEQIEVAHEALLRHWERLNRAVTGEDAKRRLHAVKQIGKEAMDWEAHGRRDDFLKQQGEPLKAARQYVDDGWLVDSESTAYVKACEDRDKFITEVVRTRKHVRWIGAAAVLGLLVVAFVLYVANVQRDAGLSTIASLAERLPPWEGLDVAYNVAKSGGKAYRFALAHALERMDDSWVLGPRDAPLFPAGDGSALLQFDKSGGKETLRVYLLGADGTPSRDPVIVELLESSDRFAQGQVGPEIKEGAAKGHRLLVLTSRPQDGARNYGIDAYLLDPKTKTSTRLEIDGDPSPLPRADEMSSIGIHPDGNRAIWSAIDYPALNSRIQELGVDAKGAARIRSLRDPVQAPKSNFDGSPNPVTAVGYSANATGPITGRLDGTVYCGDSRLLVDPRTPVDRSPIVNIVTNGAVFAATNRTGQVLAGSCNGDVHALQLLSSDPGSLHLSQVRLKSRLPWVVSFFDTDRQLRCYEFDPVSLSERWWICNAAHLIGSAISITQDGQQVVVERPGVAAVRRYANEELSRSAKQVNARQAADATLRWASRSVSANAQLDAGTSLPWLFKGGEIEAKDGRKIESATLSPDGKRVVWIERLRTADHRDVVPGIKDVERQQTVSLVGSMVRGKDGADPWMTPQSGFATAVAIDNAGNVAYVQQPPGKTILTLSSNKREFALDSYGPVQCIGYSPDGKYLAVGTLGGVLLRLATDSNGAPTRLERGAQGANAPPTSCAVSDDGAVVAGYYDGQVMFFAGNGDVLPLTTRAVYAFPVPVTDVRIEPPGSQRRVTALGGWQINNCVHAGLPGQSVRAWDVNLPKATRGTPVAMACFPNATIAALGAWGEKADDDTGECPKVGGATAASAKPGLCLITAQKSRWHACPACSTAGQTPEAVHTGVLRSAEAKGVKPLTDSELEQRYGFKLDFLP